MSIIDITMKLFDYIDNDTKENKGKLLSLLKEYKDNNKENEDKIIEAKENYNTNIKQHRLNQIDQYESYHFERNQLYIKWKKSKQYKDLLELVNFLPPEFVEIPEIYTYNYISGPNIVVTNDNPSEFIEESEDDYEEQLPKVEQPSKVEPPKVKAKPKKECPPGTILNPITGRCNKIKEPKNKK